MSQYDGSIFDRITQENMDEIDSYYIDNLKTQKSVKKSACTRTRRQLMELLDSDMPSRRAIRALQQKVDEAQEAAMETMQALIEEYKNQKDKINVKKVVDEIECLESTTTDVIERAQMYLDSRKDEASSVETRNSGSGKKKMNKDTEELSVKGSDATRREPADQTMIRQETMNQVFPVVTDQGIVQTRDEAGDSVGFQGRSGKEMVVPERAVSDPGMDMEDKMIKEEMLVKRYERQNGTVSVHISTLKKEENKREQNFYDEIIKRERERNKAAYDKEREYELLKKTRVNQYVSQLDETVRPNQTMTYDLGADLWRQLKRVKIPVFSGSKKEYEIFFIY